MGENKEENFDGEGFDNREAGGEDEVFEVERTAPTSYVLVEFEGVADGEPENER